MTESAKEHRPADGRLLARLSRHVSGAARTPTLSRRARERPSDGYVPAAGRHGLSGLYDPAVAVVMRERRFRGQLVSEVLSGDPRTILDVGCGTGTLAIQLAQHAPEAEVIGIDGDPDILKRAVSKAQRADVTVNWTHGMASAIPLQDHSVECVVSSLVFHHLPPRGKVAALEEIARVLTPAGRLVIADWGRPQDPVMRIGFFALQLLDGFESTRQHAGGEFPGLISDAGFQVTLVKQMRTVLGTLQFLIACPTSGQVAPVTPSVSIR